MTPPTSLVRRTRSNVMHVAVPASSPSRSHRGVAVRDAEQDDIESGCSSSSADLCRCVLACLHVPMTPVNTECDLVGTEFSALSCLCLTRSQAAAATSSAPRSSLDEAVRRRVPRLLCIACMHCESHALGRKGLGGGAVCSSVAHELVDYARSYGWQ